MKKHALTAAMSVLAFLLPDAGHAAGNQVPAEKDMAAYLLVYFKDETHSIHFALSSDGYSFTALNDDKPVIDGREVAEQKGLRDPYIMRGPDNRFYIAATDLHIFAQRDGLRDTEWQRDGEKYGWGNNRSLVLLRSDDLMNWDHHTLRVDQAFPDLKEIACVWAPGLNWDAEKRRIMIHFTMRYPNGLCRLYYSHMDPGFTKLEAEPRLLFEYPNDKASYIDSDIAKVGDKFVLAYTPQDPGPGVKIATSKTLTSGYVYRDAWLPVERGACEGPTIWKRIGEDKWVVTFDAYQSRPHDLGFTETSDFENFTFLGRFNHGVMKATNFSMAKHPAVIHLMKKEADALAAHWKLEKY